MGDYGIAMVACAMAMVDQVIPMVDRGMGWMTSLLWVTVAFSGGL